MLNAFTVSLPHVVALAAVALLGYLVGRQRAPRAHEMLGLPKREVARAHAVARELETIANSIRDDLNRHQGTVEHFKSRLAQLGSASDDASWKQLCQDAEDVLKPTMRLATQIAHAYDALRQQTNRLMAFTEVRTDPLTGIRNRRGFEEALNITMAMRLRYEQPFAVTIFDVDHFKDVNDEHGHLAGDQALRAVAHKLDELARETDIVARYGGEEFIVIMPQTNLAGATVFSDRLRAAVASELLAGIHLTISGGVAEAVNGDDVSSLLARADAALYEAKNTGRNRVMQHCLDFIQPCPDPIPAITATTTDSGTPSIIPTAEVLADA